MTTYTLSSKDIKPRVGMVVKLYKYLDSDIPIAAWEENPEYRIMSIVNNMIKAQNEIRKPQYSILGWNNGCLAIITHRPKTRFSILK